MDGGPTSSRRESSTSPRPARFLPELGTNAYGAHPRRRNADGKLVADYRAARAIVEEERGGRAIAPLRSPAVDVEPASAAERLIADVLGGRLIRVEPYGTVDAAIA